MRMNKHVTIAIVCLMIVYVVLSIRTCNVQRDKIESQANSIIFKDSLHNVVIKTYVDKFGKEHKVVEKLQLEKEELRQYTSRIEKELGIKTSQINSITKNRLTL